MKRSVISSLGYYGPEWDKKVQDKDNPNFWKYGVANLFFLDIVKNKKRVLDVGCGTGGSTLFLAEHASLEHIVGIDPVKTMIEVAKQHAYQRSLNHKTDFVICDGRYLPFKRSYFDALVSRGDAFVFLIPQKVAVLEFRRVLKTSAVLVLEVDNVLWKPGKIVFFGFEKLVDGSAAYCVEHFDSKRNHFKVFYVLNPKSKFTRAISRDHEFRQTGKMKRRFPLNKIRRELIEVKRGVVTHWPTIEEMKRLFVKRGFGKVEIFGDGLLMELLLEGNSKITEAMKNQPELFFEIERKLIPFIDPAKARTIIFKANAL